MRVKVQGFSFRGSGVEVFSGVWDFWFRSFGSKFGIFGSEVLGSRSRTKASRFKIAHPREGSIGGFMVCS